MKKLFLLATLFISACAAVSPSQQGINLLNKAQYQNAYNVFSACAAQGDSYCMNNIGYMYHKGHMDTGPDNAKAIEWYTLAARYGNPQAQLSLLALDKKVPTADLRVQPQPQANNDAALIMMSGALNGLHTGMQRAPTVAPVAKPTTCVTKEQFGTLKTVCQ